MATRKCKFGKLKNPVGKRVCKKKPRKASKRKSSTSDCRDASGEFVPVPQCLGKRRRKRR